MVRLEVVAHYKFVGGTAELLIADQLKNFPEWQQTFANECKDHRYYEIIEQTLANDFQYRYLALRDSSGAVRAIQPLLFVRQNLVEGIPGALRQIIESIRKKFPRLLTMRLLMVGCAAGEGKLGVIRHSGRSETESRNRAISRAADAMGSLDHARDEEQWIAEALAQSLPAIARDGKASLIVFKDFSSKYRGVLAGLTRHGFTRAPSMPMTQLALNFRDFDDYLARLSYGTRKSLRRKFRKAERAAKISLEVVSDITPYAAQVYPLYLAVQERSAMKFEKLTPQFLCMLGQRMPDRARFFIWRIENKIIAFSIALVCGDTIYDEYLGLDYSVALDLHLYFYTFRDIISWGIANNLKRYCSSPLNYDPKLHLGCELAPLDLYVQHTNTLLNPVFGRIVKLLEPTRHDPVLRHFPNAHEIYL